VGEMMRSASSSSLASEFNDFLFAPIGEERNGMLLSVLSALARLDVDPWQEAAELARLSRENATQRLASLIAAALPEKPSVRLDPGSIAARLIALLPREAGFNIPSRETMLSTGAKTNSGSIVAFVIFMTLILGAQLIAASLQPPAQTIDVHAAASNAVVPQMPPRDPGQ
jgi:hypothetical protein